MFRTHKGNLYSRDLLSCLASAQPMLPRLVSLNKHYNSLVNELLLLGEFDTTPSSKELQKRLGIGSVKLRNCIDELYNDLVEMLEQPDSVMSFSTVLVRYSVEGDKIKGHRYGLDFYLQIAIVPQINHQINLHFLTPTVGKGPFYVNEIVHEYFNELCNVALHISTLDPYVYALVKRARFEGKLPDTYYEMSTCQIEAFVRKLFVNEGSG